MTTQHEVMLNLKFEPQNSKVQVHVQVHKGLVQIYSWRCMVRNHKLRVHNSDSNLQIQVYLV